MRNEEVRNRIQNAIGVDDDGNCDSMTTFQGPLGWRRQWTVKGLIRRGRQKKRLEDNIKEWTGMEFGDPLRAAEDREMYCCNVVCGALTTVKFKGLT